MSAPTTGSTGRAQPTRRNQELALLAFAWLLGSLALANVGWGAGLGLPARYWVAVSVMGGAALVAHAAVRTLAPYAEPVMLPTAFLLNCLGLAMIYRLDIAAAQRAAENGSAEPTPEAFGQLTWTLLGVALFAACLLVVRDHRKLQRYTYISLLVGVVLLLLPLFPVIGHTVNGATLWIKVGSLTFQPGELAKIVMTVFLAGYLTTHREALATVRRKVAGVSLPRARDTGPLIVGWLLALAIMAFETDLGTALIFFGLFVSMLYVATQRIGWVVLGLAMFLIGAALLYLAFGHVRTRVQIWLDPFEYANDAGYQVVQSLYGLANGGLLGAGWGQGYPQLVPFASSDFILSSFGEELGLAGMTALMLLYAILVQRGFRTAVACRDPFGRLLAAGLSVVFGLQVFVVAGGVTKLIPMTGLTTPFLSAGGSALVANWIMVAVLLRISHITRQPVVVVTSPDQEMTQVVRL
jgi:cell division protein FtsW (lipid II flippase)